MSSANQTLAIAAALCVLVFGIICSTRKDWPRSIWGAPAIFAALFLAFSLYTVSAEGPFGFWAEHVRNSWGNQIFFDLLLAASAAFAVLVPRARAVGMKPLPWFVLILCTGSIGILAMVARCLFLERKTASAN